MLPVSESYQESVYERLNESVLEHMDEDMVDKLVPHLKRSLCEELARRREAVQKVEAVMAALFPGEGYEAPKQG